MRYLVGSLGFYSSENLRLQASKGSFWSKLGLRQDILASEHSVLLNFITQLEPADHVEGRAVSPGWVQVGQVQVSSAWEGLLHCSSKPPP